MSRMFAQYFTSFLMLDHEKVDFLWKQKQKSLTYYFLKKILFCDNSIIDFN